MRRKPLNSRCRVRGTRYAHILGMNDLTALLRAADRMGRALEDLRAAISDLTSPLPRECPLCRDCGAMFDRESGYLVPCVCGEHGYDEQREARGQ